jgi:TonB-dependent receptor
MTAVSFEASLFAHGAIAADQTQSSSQSTSQAATNDNSELSEIVVTGYRQSLQTALDTKRDSNLSIESVAPEDIGKMPDNNVAESLQRLPGVQIDRSGANGQGTSVLIDGLRQNLVTLNGDVFLTGKEFYVSGEASGGGAGANSQYASLQSIPSELVSGIDVIKNPSASITEGGLGGTVNLKTADPLLAPDGLSLGGLFRESDAQRQNDKTPDATLVGSYKLNDRLAFSGSLTYSDLKTMTDEYQAANRSGWVISNSATKPYVGSLTAADVGTISQNYIIPQLGYFTNVNDETKDRGASFDIGLKITDSIQSNFLWFYAREEETTLDYSDKAWFNGQDTNPQPGIDPTKPYSIDGNNVVQNATFNGDALSGQHFAGQQLSMGDQVRRRRTASRPVRRVFCACDLEPAGGPGRRRARPLRYEQRRRHLPERTRMQQRSAMPQFDHGQSRLRIQLFQRWDLGPALGKLFAPQCAQQPGIHDLQIELGVGEFDR